MLQVRWSLNAGSNPNKRKTLACDYNPINKRLRDFGAMAKEVDVAPVVQATSQGPGSKSAKSAKAAKPPPKAGGQRAGPHDPSASGSAPPLGLSSFLDELEGSAFSSSHHYSTGLHPASGLGGLSGSRSPEQLTHHVHHHHYGGYPHFAGSALSHLTAGVGLDDRLFLSHGMTAESLNLSGSAVVSQLGAHGGRASAHGMFSNAHTAAAASALAAKQNEQQQAHASDGYGCDSHSGPPESTMVEDPLYFLISNDAEEDRVALEQQRQQRIAKEQAAKEHAEAAVSKKVQEARAAALSPSRASAPSRPSAPARGAPAPLPSLPNAAPLRRDPPSLDRSKTFSNASLSTQQGDDEAPLAGFGMQRSISSVDRDFNSLACELLTDQLEAFADSVTPNADGAMLGGFGSAFADFADLDVGPVDGHVAVGAPAVAPSAEDIAFARLCGGNGMQGMDSLADLHSMPMVGGLTFTGFDSPMRGRKGSSKPAGGKPSGGKPRNTKTKAKQAEEAAAAEQQAAEQQAAEQQAAASGGRAGTRSGGMRANASYNELSALGSPSTGGCSPTPFSASSPTPTVIDARGITTPSESSENKKGRMATTTKWQSLHPAGEQRFIAAGKMAATSIPQQGVISVDAMNASAPMNGNGGGGASANDGAQRPAAVPSMGRTFSWQSLKIAQYGVTQ